MALGSALRAARVTAGLTSRDIPGVSSGHISQVENGRVLPSESLVRKYLAFGGDAGRLLGLLDRARAVRNQDETPASAAQLTDVSTDPHILRRGYTIEQVTDRHRFGSNRDLVRISHLATIHLVNQASRYFPIRYSYEDDPRPGVAMVEPGDGCRVVRHTDDAEGTVYAVLDFGDAPRDSAGATGVSWTITVNSQAPSRPRVVAGTSTRLPAACVAAEFAEGTAPAEVMHFRAFDHRVTPKRNDAVPLESGQCQHRFHDLEREWWGLAWTWPGA